MTSWEMAEERKKTLYFNNFNSTFPCFLNKELHVFIEHWALQMELAQLPPLVPLNSTPEEAHCYGLNVCVPTISQVHMLKS